MHKLIAFHVSSNETAEGEVTVIRVQPTSGSSAQSTDIIVTLRESVERFDVEGNAHMLPGIFSGGHLLSVLLPKVYERFNDAETFAEALATPIDIEVEAQSV